MKRGRSTARPGRPATTPTSPPTFDRKAAAVRAHRSQIENPDTLPERLRERIAANTAAAGLPGDRLAEAFQVVVTG